MKKLKPIFLAASLLFTNYCFTQNVGINASGANPNASAGLDIDFTSKGLLIPRMTTAQRDSIPNAALGLQIFNTSTNCLQFYIGGSWQNIACGCTAAPATPGTITGSTSTCSGQSSVSYSITPVAGATLYTWAVPAGTAIITGQGTSAITVNFGTSSGNVSVSASNNCGNSTARILAVTVSNIPATPGTITGSTNVCSGQSGLNYSVAAVSGASSYTWTLPTGAGITAGTGTRAITVTMGSSGGSISVTASNSCGTSASSSLAITTGGTNYPYTSVTSGLSAWWKFNEGTGSNTVDSSGNGYTASLNGGAAWTNNGIFCSKAISFNGSGAYVRFPGIPAGTGSNISFSFWINLSSLTGADQVVVSYGGSPGAGCVSPGVTVDATGKVQFSLYKTGQCNITMPSTTTLVPGTWYHVVATYDGVYVKTYINGVLDAQSAYNCGSSDCSNTYIGGNAAYSSAWVNGVVDDVRIYNRGISTSEVLQIYNTQ